jgi:hypothetical protein
MVMGAADTGNGFTRTHLDTQCTPQKQQAGAQEQEKRAGNARFIPQAHKVNLGRTMPEGEMPSIPGHGSDSDASGSDLFGINSFLCGLFR